MFRSKKCEEPKPEPKTTCELQKEVTEMKAMLLQQNEHLQKLLAKQLKKGPCDGLDEDVKSTVVVGNPNLENMSVDYLYHLALDTKTHNLERLFGDVKFIVTGGTPQRMEKFAYYIMNEIGFKLHAGASLNDISQKGNRYAMYKVGPVLAVSHGMGTPSIGILLNELIKLCYYANMQDPVFFRMGTSGGIGIPPGTVVITDEALDGQLRKSQEIVVMGQVQTHSTKLDRPLAEELKSMTNCKDGFGTVIGNTLCTNDFYEGQARLDGAFCSYTEDQKNKFLQDLNRKGVLNIEMESAMFAAATKRANIRAAVVCVTLLDRLSGDQISTPKEELEEWTNRPGMLIGRYIKRVLHGGPPAETEPGSSQPRNSVEK